MKFHFSYLLIGLLTLSALGQTHQDPSNAPVAGGVSVAGVAVKEDGSPVADATIRLLRRGAYAGLPDPRSVKAGADGRFAFEGVAEGEYRIWAVSGNLASWDKQQQGQIIRVPGPGGSFEPVKLTVHPGRTVRATVTSAADGMPIAGASLRVARGFSIPECKTDADGRATIGALAAGTVELEVTAPRKAKVSKTVNLVNDTETAVDFSLPDGGSVQGKITDNSGKPLAGIGVNVYPRDSGMPMGYVATGDDGTYLFDHVPLDQPCRICFGNDAYDSAWDHFELSAASRQVELNVKLQPKPEGGSVTGSVIDRDGVPIPGAKITYYGHSTSTVKSATTNEHGDFRIDGIESRQGMNEQIIVRADGWAPIAVPIEPGTKEQPTQVSARMMEKGHTITGLVVNEKGEPIQGVRVEAGKRTVMDNRGSSAITLNDGVFKFNSLPANVTFEFRAEGYSEIQLEELPLDQPEQVTVEMKRLSSIVGTVVDADTHQALPKFNIKMRTTNMSTQRLEQGEDFGGATGAFRLDGLAAGIRMTLVVSAEGYSVQYFDDVATAPADSGESVALELYKIPPDHVRIAGRIINASGKPIAGVEIRTLMYMPPDPQRPRHMRFDWSMLKSGQLSYQDYIRGIESVKSAADGTFAFPSLKGPDIDLAYWGAGVPQTRIENVASMPAEQREHLALTVAPPATLGGKINRDVYADLSELQLQSKTEPSLQITLNPKPNADRYDFDSVPAGSYTLLIWGKPMGNPDGTFQLEKLGSEQIELKEAEAGKLDLGFTP